MKRKPVTASTEVDAFLDALEALSMSDWREIHARFEQVRDAQWRKLSDFIFDTIKTSITWDTMTAAAEKKWNAEMDRQSDRAIAVVARLPKKAAGDQNFAMKLEFVIGKQVAALRLNELGESEKGRQVLTTLSGIFEGFTGTG